MRMDSNMRTALNDQINMELFAMYQYLAMAAYLDSINMVGASQWMLHQSDEERGHAMKLYDFMMDRDEVPALKAIGEPQQSFESPVKVFELALEHERKVSASIHALFDLAMEHADHPARVMLQWFIEEQVEEEKSVGDVLDRLKLAGDHPGALFFIDHELGNGHAGSGAGHAT